MYFSGIRRKRVVLRCAEDVDRVSRSDHVLGLEPLRGDDFPDALVDDLVVVAVQAHQHIVFEVQADKGGKLPLADVVIGCTTG